LLIVIATLTLRWPFANMSEGELRCESGGAVVVKIAGKGYAVNGMASTRYPPIQQIWNDAYDPGTNIDRITTRGLTIDAGCRMGMLHCESLAFLG
jgi:hypothetical protein